MVFLIFFNNTFQLNRLNLYQYKDIYSALLILQIDLPLLCENKVKYLYDKTILIKKIRLTNVKFMVVASNEQRDDFIYYKLYKVDSP